MGDGGTQTVLGAGGVLGNALARSLHDHASSVRLVSRHPKSVVCDEELVAADLLDAAAVRNAVAGSSVAYLTAGFPYRLKLWRDAWPKTMRNTLDACKQAGAKLVFFDNIYALDPSRIGRMTEETPLRPSSRKGQVRKEVGELLLETARAGDVGASIVRSADFYGPGANSSVLTQMVPARLAAGRGAWWPVDPGRVHSASFVPDAGAATALIGNTEDAFGQVWNVPTDPEPITGRAWAERFAQAFGAPAKLKVLGRGSFRLFGLFSADVRELVEMLYQYDRDYFLDSGKFSARFPDFKATPYAEGIAKTVESHRKG